MAVAVPVAMAVAVAAAVTAAAAAAEAVVMLGALLEFVVLVVVMRRTTCSIKDRGSVWQTGRKTEREKGTDGERQIVMRRTACSIRRRFWLGEAEMELLYRGC
eukprot:22707-Chlamydomonas_euryale.AAC.5